MVSTYAESSVNSVPTSQMTRINLKGKSSRYGNSSTINNRQVLPSFKTQYESYMVPLAIIILIIENCKKFIKCIKDKPENFENKIENIGEIQVCSDANGNEAEVKRKSSRFQKDPKYKGYSHDKEFNFYYYHADDSKIEQHVPSINHSSADSIKPVPNDMDKEGSDKTGKGDEVNQSDECEGVMTEISKAMSVSVHDVTNPKSKENESEEKPDNGDGHDSPDNERRSRDILSDLIQQSTFRFKPQESTLVVYMMPDAQIHPNAIDDIPWRWLREEIWRIHTFARYPHKTAKSALLLAAEGFAYVGSGKGSDDTVICFFCCGRKQNWLELDVISEVHKRLSPQCPMVTGINCNNVPMTTPQQGTTLFEHLQNRSALSEKPKGNRPAQSGQSRDEIQSDSVPDVAQPQRTATTAVTSGNKQSRGKPAQMAQTTIMHPPIATPAPRSAVITSTVIAHQPTSENVPTATVTSINRLGDNNGSGSQASRVNAPSVGSGSAVQNGEQRPTPTTATNISNTASANSASSSNVVRSTTSPAPTNTSVTQSSSSTSRNPSTSAQTTAARSSTIPPSNSSAPSTNGSATNTAQSSSANAQGSRPPNRGPTYSDLGIITERPKRYEYAVKAKRLQSFDPWPRDHHLRKEDLADAGFYYAGYGDCARCFYCGGGLRNWEDEDNVWIEHARWFPKCAFMRQTMGQAFVDVVQDLNQANDKITFFMIEKKLGAVAETFQLGVSREEPLKRDPAVMTVIDMGYSEKDCLEAARFVKDNSGVLSADKIFEKLVQEEKAKTQKPNAADPHVVGISSDPSRDEDTLKTLKEQNNQLRQQTVCKICMDKEVAVVFLPCGHLVSCTDCASAMKDCPVCRNQVKGIVRAFMG